MRDSYITLALHSTRTAERIIKELQSAGIDVVKENIGNTNDVRIKVREYEASDAIRVMEAVPDKSLVAAEMQITGMSPNVLVPVDLTDSGILAVKTAFMLASRMKISPILLHTYITPSIKDTFLGPDDASSPGELAVAQLGIRMRSEAETEFSAFCTKVSSLIKSGEICDVPFTCTLQEGVPEEVIVEYCKQTPPALVVMVTRNISRREEEMVGSVTAEVADSCRVPLLAIPDSYHPEIVDNLEKVLFLCNLDQQDFLSMDIFQRYFNFPKTEIYVTPVIDQRRATSTRLNAMLSYFRATYASSTFIETLVPDKSIRTQLEKKLGNVDFSLIVVPDKKRNIFSRIFKPSIPHRILFEKDIPMLVVPV